MEMSFYLISISFSQTRSYINPSIGILIASLLVDGTASVCCNLCFYQRMSTTTLDTNKDKQELRLDNHG
jgi:hypothetical protein